MNYHFSLPSVFHLKIESDMPSFDIVAETNKVELRHAVDNTVREITNRFDFHGVLATVTLEELTVTIQSESDFQVRQLEEMFKNQCAKRSLSTAGIDIDDKPIHSGKTHTLTLTFKEGIDQPTAKELIKRIKNAKIKVQSSIQGDKIRVSGKNRDDLQKTIALLKDAEVNLPLQFINFRD